MLEKICYGRANLSSFKQATILSLTTQTVLREAKSEGLMMDRGSVHLDPFSMEDANMVFQCPACSGEYKKY